MNCLESPLLKHLSDKPIEKLLLIKGKTNGIIYLSHSEIKSITERGKLLFHEMNYDRKFL